MRLAPCLAVSCSPPAELEAPLEPGPGPPRTDLSFAPAPRAPTAAM